MSNIRNIALRESVEYWVDLNSYYADVFSIYSKLLSIVDIFLLEYKQISDIVVSNFVSGLAGSSHAKIETEPYKLMEPLLKLLIEYINSKEIQNSIIKEYIYGDEVMEYNGLRFPITPKKIIDFANNNMHKVYSPEDADVIAAQYSAYKRGILEKHGPTVVKREEEIDEDISGYIFRNNFDRVPEEEIKNYFYLQLVKKGKYISNETLKAFLRLAFEEMSFPEKKLPISCPNMKRKVRKIFYAYYNDIAHKPHKRQTDYVKLLGEYFEGFNTKSLKTNFSKDY